MLRERGWHVIDTDQIAHNVLAVDGAAWKNVVDAFGASVLQPDKSIDRKVLGRLVFADPSLRAKLNEITHPVIRSVWQHEREERVRTHPTQSLAVMIPLLFECQLEKVFSVVWSVGASRVTQVKRLEGRGLTRLESEQRLSSQLSVFEKMTRSAKVLWNEGSMNILSRQLDRVCLP